jgi:hypothetical protein
VTGPDRRVKLLRLTRRGRRLRAKLAERVAEGSTVGARLNHQERENLAAILDKLLS